MVYGLPAFIANLYREPEFDFFWLTVGWVFVMFIGLYLNKD